MSWGLKEELAVVSEKWKKKHKMRGGDGIE